MEATRVNESSGCEALSQNKSTSDEIVEDFQIKKSLIVTEKGKFKWIGTFENLIKLMKELTGEVGWNSPGGDCKMLKTDGVEVRWYSTSNSLTINGEAREEMKAQLRVITNIDHLQNKVFDENALGEGVDYNGRTCLANSTEQSDDYKIESLLFVIQRLEENFQLKFSDLKTEIQEIKRDLQLERPVEKSMAAENTSINNSDLLVGEYIESIKNENDKLKKENTVLQGEMNSYKMIASDLNVKIEELTCEKKSLVTAIKILQEDQTQHNQWNVIKNSKTIKHNKEGHANKASEQRVQSSALSTNRYAMLNISDTEEDEPFSVKNKSREQQTKSNIGEVETRKNASKNVNGVNDITENDDQTTQKSKEQKKSSAKRKNNRSILNISDSEEDEPLRVRIKSCEQQPKSSNIGEGQRRKNASKNVSGVNDISESDDQKQSRAKCKNNPSVLVMGDSMLKHLSQQKISRSTNAKVKVKSFSGATIIDMKDHVKPGLRTNPDNVILHIGTNDIRSKEAPVIVDQLVELCDQIKKSNPKTKVSISEIIKRDDNEVFQTKVDEVNKLLKVNFSKSQISVLGHANIDKRGLNRYGLHLNRSGTSLLAKNLIEHIKCF